MKKLYQLAYHKYPELIQKLNTMPERYNDLQEKIKQLETEKKIFVIRPQKEVKVARLEKDTEKLQNLYQEGIDDVNRLMKDLTEYIES